MDDTIRCGRCGKDIEPAEFVAHRAGHGMGFKGEAVEVEPVQRDPEDASSPDYVPAYARQGLFTLMTADSFGPPLNTHLRQLQPRADVRPAKLDEAIEEERRKAAARRSSGSNLIR